MKTKDEIWHEIERIYEEMEQTVNLDDRYYEIKGMAEALRWVMADKPCDLLAEDIAL